MHSNKATPVGEKKTMGEGLLPQICTFNERGPQGDQAARGPSKGEGRERKVRSINRRGQGGFGEGEEGLSYRNS